MHSDLALTKERTFPLEPEKSLPSLNSHLQISLKSLKLPPQSMDQLHPKFADGLSRWNRPLLKDARAPRLPYKLESQATDKLTSQISIWPHRLCPEVWYLYREHLDLSHLKSKDVCLCLIPHGRACPYPPRNGSHIKTLGGSCQSCRTKGQSQQQCLYVLL